MADKNLQSITFPGLTDKYVVPQVDNTLTQAGRPADAKKTGDEITELKNDLSQYTNHEYTFNKVEGAPPWVVGYYINTSGATVDISSKVAASTEMYLTISCSEGDMFVISGKGGNSARLWCFIDASGNALSASDASVTEANKLITAPENAYCLIVNVDKNVGPRGVWRVDKDDYISAEYLFNSGFTPIKIQGNPPWVINAYLNLSGSSVDLSDPIASNSMMYLVFECKEGDVFVISGQGGNSGRLWAFVDAEYNIITRELPNVTIDNKRVKAPTNAKYIIVNTARNYETRSVYKYIKEPNYTNHIRFLVFGNSYSCDWCSYVPFILKDLGITCEIYNYVRDRLTLKDLYNRWESSDSTDTETDEPAGTYDRNLYYIDTRSMGAWEHVARKSAKELVEMGNYDFITLQQSVHYATDAQSFDPWLMLDIDLINNSIDKNTPISFVGVITKPEDDRPETNLDVLENTVMKNYPFSFVIPYGTAVFNARTNENLSDIGGSTYKNFWSSDNIHLQDGLPRYTASLAAAQAIVKNVFPNKSIMFNKLRVTTDDITLWKIAQPHTPVVGITADNCLLVQQASVLANNYPYTITTIDDIPEAP